MKNMEETNIEETVSKKVPKCKFKVVNGKDI